MTPIQRETEPAKRSVLAPSRALSAMLVATLILACERAPGVPRIPQGTASAPNVVWIALPDGGSSALRTTIEHRESWRKLADDLLALRRQAEYPQPALDPAFRAAAERAAWDLLDPIEGLDPSFDATGVPGDGVVTLIAVEVLPDTTIQRLHGSDAFTDAAYDLDRYEISRALVRLPSWLLEESPDDFANFFAHELGHALGLEEHVAEMWDQPEDATWFWDRLMTVPIRPGQPWQPATSEDIFAIAEGRYRLRDGWIDGRLPRFEEAAPYRRTRPAP